MILADCLGERLALQARTLFLVSFGFYLFLIASMVLLGGAPFLAVVRAPAAVGHVLASSTMGVLWLVTSRTRLSLRTMGALDAVSMGLAGGVLSLMSLVDEGQILQTLLALTVSYVLPVVVLPVVLQMMRRRGA